MYCEYCGAEINEGSFFCEYCGAEISNDSLAYMDYKKELQDKSLFNTSGLGRANDKAKLSILVMKESLYSEYRWKLMSFLWFVNIFKPSSGINIYIDVDPEDKIYKEKYCRELRPSKEPYIIELENGQHEIFFEDDNVDKKTRSGLLMKIIFSIFGWAIAWSMDAGDLVDFSGSDNGTQIEPGRISITLTPGETVKLSCRPNRKGQVIIKQLP